MNITSKVKLARAVMILAATALLQACGGSNEGSTTSVTVTVTSPGIVSPQSGSQIGEIRPTLTLSNSTASDGSTPSYTFQVATDSGFANIVVQQNGVAQGSGGQTSWRVTVDLTNRQYFWRASAQSGSASSPFSQTANFTITGGLAPGDQVVIDDPLTNGMTIGRASGGELTDRGWRVLSNDDFLRYEVNAISSGFVQWSNLGLTVRGATVDSQMLFGMWDPSAGGYRQNAFRVNLQKLWGPVHNPPWLRFRWISGGVEQEGTSNYLQYDPGTVYTWRVQWGPAAGAQTAKVLLNGTELIQVRYNRPYLPNTHWIEFGPSERHESVIDAIYFDVLIGTRQ